MLDATFGPCDAKRTETIDLRQINRVNMAALERATSRGFSGRCRNYNKATSAAFMRRVEFDWIRRSSSGRPGIIVEVHGGQHEQPVARFGGTTQFVHRVESDHDKHHWAVANNFIVRHVSNTKFGDSKQLCGEPLFRNRMRQAISSIQEEIEIARAGLRPNALAQPRSPVGHAGAPHIGRTNGGVGVGVGSGGDDGATSRLGYAGFVDDDDDDGGDDDGGSDASEEQPEWIPPASQRQRQSTSHGRPGGR